MATGEATLANVTNTDETRQNIEEVTRQKNLQTLIDNQVVSATATGKEFYFIFLIYCITTKDVVFKTFGCDVLPTA